MLMRSRAVVAAVLLVVALSGSVSVGAVSAVAAPAKEATRTTTVVTQGGVSDERSPAITVLLVGVGAAVGVIVGVIPALAAAMLLGYVPSPRLARLARRAGGVLVEPSGAARPVYEPSSEPEPEPELAPPELVVLGAQAALAPDPPVRTGQLAILAHARHQSVYDAAYAQQLDRVEALRSAIGVRRRTPPPEPPSDSIPDRS